MQVNATMARLRRLQAVLEGAGRGKDVRMAVRLGVSLQRWHNIVHGGQSLSLSLALLIVERCPGVSLDWLFLGRTQGLSHKMARSLNDPEL